MNQAETKEIINEYLQQTGKALSDEVSTVFYKLLALCEHWESIGKQDAASGRFTPPYPKDSDTKDDFLRIIEFLRECYIDGYRSICGAEEHG